MFDITGGRTGTHPAGNHVRAERRAARAGLALFQQIRRFRKEEDGNAIILTMFMFLFMLVMAGLGIDTMRHEMERAHLQATLDSAVLAGAGAPRGTDKTEVKAIIEDYFAKSDMASYLHDIDIDGEGTDDIVTSLNSTKVRASASMTLDTYLMKLSGVDQLEAAGAAAAEVRTPKLEIVIVLDVSGSMEGDKLTNLQAAAKEFVTTVLSGSEPGNTVISIVPFSWSVTPGWTIFNSLAVDLKHNYSTCLKFKDNDFNHATLTTGASAVSSGIPVDQMIYTSVYGSFDNLNQEWRSCYTENYMEILPYSISEAALHAKIDALKADGNTSGHQGMNWGAALLDPSFRKVSGDLIATGEVDGTLTNVPSNYNEPETLKVIVMMGDGANTISYFFDKSNPKYRGAQSDLYQIKYQDRVFKYAYHVYKHTKSNDESKCGKNKWECVYEAHGPEMSVYYLHDANDSRYYAAEADDPEMADNWLSSSEFNDLPNTLEGYISTERLSWEMAWGLITPEYYGNITGDWGPWNDYVGSESLNGSAKNTRMLGVCSATKTEGVVVYTIGFEVPSGGTAETTLTACASTLNHYYPASGTNISAAFNSIASNVQNLRLTE